MQRNELYQILKKLSQGYIEKRNKETIKTGDNSK